ncbi:MAG: helix-turn-helix transcriptional regulator [Chloroflexota bacterium]
MPGRERLAYLGTRRGERLVREFADEVREARHAAGLSQDAVARAIGVSKATIGRLERSARPRPDMILAARVARVVGLDLTMKCYPAAGRLRDAAHLKLLERFTGRLHPGIGRKFEAPVRPDDQRAWDLLLQIGEQLVGVAAETRIRDLHALLRREFRKLEDGSVQRLLVVAAATHANREAVRETEILKAALPLGAREALLALREGEPLRAHSLILI